ncbi:hypothetical protein BaRGS_00014792 [Batillaria attramentaria]|uniref:Uncharacterized protein n=1 Tax=Batillaria attramentaria TaxID=370345 RepID=A0ABD0L356_9CAEN
MENVLRFMIPASSLFSYQVFKRAFQAISSQIKQRREHLEVFIKQESRVPRQPIDSTDGAYVSVKQSGLVSRSFSFSSTTCMQSGMAGVTSNKHCTPHFVFVSGYVQHAQLANIGCCHTPRGHTPSHCVKIALCHTTGTLVAEFA